MRTRATARETSPRGERGAVTAETALALPVLAAVALAMVWLLTLGLAQMRVADAAREAARAVARGDGVARAEELAHAAAPGSRVSVEAGGGVVRVSVSTVMRPPGGLLGHLGAATLTADAEGLVEGGAQP
jgi:Flp pilus assembly protein TadG